MKLPRFYVGDGSGGYAELFTWHEAENLAIEESKTEGVRVIQSEKNGMYVALFFEGERYIPAKGNICECCLAPLPVEQASYVYVLTGHFFCSEKCGIALGVLVNRPKE
jgi:hypothetical protein